MLTIFEKCLLDNSNGGSTFERLYLDKNAKEGLDDLNPGIYPEKSLAIVQNHPFIANQPLSLGGCDSFLIASSGSGFRGKGQGKVMIPNEQEPPEVIGAVSYEDCGASWHTFAFGLKPGDIVRVFWQWGGYIHPSTYYIVRSNGVVESFSDAWKALEICRKDHIPSPFRLVDRRRRVIAPLKDWQVILP